MLYYRIDNITPSLKLGFTVTLHICESINTPRSLAVALMLQYGEWGEYMALTTDPSTYEEPSHFANDHLVTEILRKHPDIPLGIDKQAVALEAFIASEEHCAETNERLKTEIPEWYFTFRRSIYKILGPLTRLDLDYVDSKMRHGPGASTGVRGHGSCSSDKYDKPIHLTAELIPYYKAITGEQWRFLHHQPNVIVEGSKFTTVPKSAKTERGICIEPTLNVYVQLGIGQLIRRKLRNFGLNLNQQDLNRRMAKDAYSKGYATIDLSAASDSTSTELILQYFPERWVQLLELCRSGKTRLPDGSMVPLEKWSSMGNGYTFELETLVFYALCISVIPFEFQDQITVYGDDIIVPQQYAQCVIEALNFLGFKVNESKSYLAGNFFESCGHDYFKGVNVRPFYLKGPMKSERIPEALQVANKIRLYARSRNGNISCDSTFLPAWKCAVSSIPRIWRNCKIPHFLGDVGLISSRSEANAKKPMHGWEGFVCRHMVQVPVSVTKTTPSVILTALERGLPRRMSDFDELLYAHRKFNMWKEAKIPTKGRQPRRGYLRKPRPKKSVVDQWTSGLDWDHFSK